MKPGDAANGEKRHFKPSESNDLPHSVPAIDRHNPRPHGSWIGFGEIADWLSREDGSIVADGRKRLRAFQELFDGALAREFDRDGETMFEFRPANGPAIGWSVE